MMDGTAFIDFYSILQVDWNCDQKSLEHAYRFLAKKYHPDHPDSSDADKFNDVVQAYRSLRNPEQRAEYDLQYAVNVPGAVPKFRSGGADPVDENIALSDGEVHERTLRLLYTKRRECALDAGVAPFLVQEMLQCTEEHFNFHMWYLKAKGFIETTEQGTLAITIQGIDHVISMSRTNRAEKLRIAQSDEYRE